MVSVSCLTHTVLILIIFLYQSKSSQAKKYLCSTELDLVKRVEWGYNEFRVWPGQKDGNGDCDYGPNAYAQVNIKKKGGFKQACKCIEVNDGRDLCVRVAEMDGKDSTVPNHCGTSSFFHLSKDIKKDVRVNVKKKCGAGNTDGKVDVRMVYQDCNSCDGCSSSSSDDKKGGGGYSGGYSSGGDGGSGGYYRFEQYQAMENDEEVDNNSMLQSEPDKTPQNRTMFSIIGASAGLFVLCMILTVFVCIRRKGGNKYETSNTQNDEESDDEVVENVELEMMNNETDTIEERIKEKVTAS